MKAAIYARVSKPNDTQTPDNQVHDLTAWAARLGHDLVHVYVDKQTGSTDDRPALKEALTAAHRAAVRPVARRRPGPYQPGRRGVAGGHLGEAQSGGCRDQESSGRV